MDPVEAMDALAFRLMPAPEPGEKDELANSIHITRAYVMFGHDIPMSKIAPHYVLTREHVFPIVYTDDSWFTNCNRGVLASHLLSELQSLQLLAEIGLSKIGRLVAARAGHSALGQTSLIDIMAKAGHSVPYRSAVTKWPTVNGQCDPVALAYSVLHSGMNAWKSAQIMRHVNFNSHIMLCWYLTLGAVGESWARRGYRPLEDLSDMPALPFLDTVGRSIVTHHSEAVDVSLFPVGYSHDEDTVVNVDGAPVPSLLFSTPQHNLLITRTTHENLPTAHSTASKPDTPADSIAVANGKVS